MPTAGTWPVQQPAPAYQPAPAPSFHDFAAQIEKSVKAEVVKAAEMEFERIQLAHKAEMQRMQQALDEKQHEVDAAKLDAANQHAQQQSNDAWQNTQQQQHMPIQKEDNKRRKHGKICFSCYELASYHGQGTCSITTCPLNGGLSPYQGLDALKLNVETELSKLFGQMKLLEKQLDDQSHEMQVMANRIQELEVNSAKFH